MAKAQERKLVLAPNEHTQMRYAVQTVGCTPDVILGHVVCGHDGLWRIETLGWNTPGEAADAIIATRPGK